MPRFICNMPSYCELEWGELVSSPLSSAFLLSCAFLLILVYSWPLVRISTDRLTRKPVLFDLKRVGLKPAQFVILIVSVMSRDMWNREQFDPIHELEPYRAGIAWNWYARLEPHKPARIVRIQPAIKIFPFQPTIKIFPFQPAIKISLLLFW